MNTGNQDSLTSRVLNTIKEHNLIKEDDSVVLGISGGPDSVCLLHVLHSLKSVLNMKIFAVHVNHMLRGDESDEDEQYVRSLCNNMGIPLSVEAFNVKKIASKEKISLEEAGRKLRYDRFEDTASRVGASRVAVAHNRNDQAETVLMNILRGSGLDGLKGMEYLNGRIIRPLLGIDRKSIEEYCREHSLDYRTDSSNLESVFTRNKIRREIIPFINKAMGVDSTESICRMASLLRDDQHFIDDAAKAYYEKCVATRKEKEVDILIPVFEQYHPAMQKRVLRCAFLELLGNIKGVESIHVNEAMKLALKGRTGAEIHLPRRIQVSKSYELLRIFICNNSKEILQFEEEILIPGVTNIRETGAVLEAFKEKRLEDIEVRDNIGYNSLEQIFDYEKVKMGINIRNRRQGDNFKPFRSNGTKKLKEFFIDSKVPAHTRNEIPLVVQGNEVVWIVGYKISDKFKVTENTKTVLRLKYNKA